MNFITKIFASISLLFLATISMAATPSPLTQTQQVTDKVLAQLKAHEVSMKSDPTVVYGIINKYLLPHVDTEMMAKSVLGREGWAKATPDQQKQFTTLFTTLMTYTYSSALAKYNNQTIQYAPVRGGYEGKTLITLNSQVIQPDGPPINLTYNLILHGDQWYVYDISVEGISLLESFRQQFSNMLQNEGMDALLKNLAAHNAAIAKRNQEAASND